MTMMMVKTVGCSQPASDDVDEDKDDEDDDRDAVGEEAEEEEEEEEEEEDEEAEEEAEEDTSLLATPSWCRCTAFPTRPTALSSSRKSRCKSSTSVPCCSMHTRSSCDMSTSPMPFTARLNSGALKVPFMSYVQAQ